MKIFKKEVVFEGKFIRVIAKHFENAKGEKGVWEAIERKQPKKEAVCVFALTKDKEVIIEKIYRMPHECYVLEMPAGTCDEGESHIEAAKRELLEEAGYKAIHIEQVFRATGDMSLVDLDVVYFFANVEYAGKSKLDKAEEIEVLKIPLTEMVDTALNPPAGVKVAYDFLALLPILQKKNLI